MRSAFKQIRIFLYGRRGQSGAVLAEFAVAAPILAMLLVGVAGLSSYLIEVEKLNSAVEAGVLHVTRNGWDWANVNNATNVIAAVNAAGDTAVNSASAACFYGCPTTAGVVATGTTCNYSNQAPNPPATCSATGSANAPGLYVTITASAPFTNPVAAGMAGLFGVTLPSSITLSATTRAK
ncbi:TadE/TadG family type IV pilus assembly protein [Methylocystis sp. JAN1]|uniref:TadE/TadG family type IV pilus assembly protein n=1 Tax=Methylocystis sp. JAN1 TaxID=3397211 RepID=UPI003FA20C00